MKITDYVQCLDFACADVRKLSYMVPNIEFDPESIKIMLISETTPNDPWDYYYAGDEAMFARTTVQAFKEAGVSVTNVRELQDMGIYLTTAVKCGKYDYAVATSAIVNCSSLLEREIELFPNVKAYLLMGDVAIRAFNTIAKRQGEPRVIPAGSTYKIRGGEFTYRGKRVFPSYLQAGPSFGIEKSKVRMIGEDIAAALRIADL